jgi:hypothetical protein
MVRSRLPQEVGGFLGERPMRRLVCLGRGCVAPGSTGAGGLADGVQAGAGDAASILVGAIVGAMVGAGGGGVMVIRIVGTTAPVCPTGSRDTTRSAGFAPRLIDGVGELTIIVEDDHIRTFRRRWPGRARVDPLSPR